MPTLARLTSRPSPARAHRERGQVLILFVMGATVIFLIGAIVVDIGLWVSERRNAQAAADLASLAAATQLRDPTDPNGAARAKGLDFARRNGFEPGPNIDVQVNPDTGNETVEVTIDEQGVSLFAGIFGITSPHVGASAVAAYGASPPGPDAALFASSSDCNAGQTLDIQAQHLQVNGSTHSNGNLFVDGPQDDFVGPVTWVCPNGFTNNHVNNSYQPPPRMVGNQAPPLDLKWTDIEPYCDGVALGDLVITNLSPWENKVICASSNLTLNVVGVQAHVTLAAQGSVTILGAGNNLQPADKLARTGFDQLLVYSSTDGINIVTPGGVYTGYIHAPRSRVTIDGSHIGTDVFRLDGAVVAASIRITGNWFEFHGAGLQGPPGPPQVHLED